MKKFNSTQRCFILIIVALVVSALLAHTKIVTLAIGGGFFVSFLLSVFTKGEKKYWFSDTISALIGSQMGWAALLI